MMIPLRSRGVLAIVVSAAAACGSSTPAAPSAPAPSAVVLSGTVTDRASSAALPGATVAILDGANAGRSTTADATGAYRLTGLTAGGFTARASVAGYAPATQPVALTADGVLAFTLDRLAVATLDNVPATVGVRQVDGTYSVTLQGHQDPLSEDVRDNDDDP